MIAFYPGSFDPFTLGHEDIVRRALKFCNKLIIGVSHDNFKNSLLTCEQREALIKLIFSKNKRIEVLVYEGLTVESVKKFNVDVILKGVRNIDDFTIESQMAQLNSMMDNDMETIFLASSDKFRSISSSMVKQIYDLNGDISPFVPSPVLNFLRDLK